MSEPSPGPRHAPGEDETLRDVVAEFEAAGYTGQFGARAGGMVRCFACRHEFPPSDVDATALRRLEGASDPDDMLAVLPVSCPNCATRGTLVLAYGPEAPIEDSEILAALPDARLGVHPAEPPAAEGTTHGGGAHTRPAG